MRRYGFLRLLCNIGQVASVVALVVGLGALFYALSGGGRRLDGLFPSLIVIASAMGSYISCEAVQVLIAIESHTRKTATVLRRQYSQRRALPPGDDAFDDENESEAS